MEEGSVSLTFIMIKEKPVYPYNAPPPFSSQSPTMSPVFTECCLRKALAERRCQEQLTPPLLKSIRRSPLCFHFHSSQRDFIKVSSDKLSPFRFLLRHQPLGISDEVKGQWRQRLCECGLDESRGGCYRMIRVRPSPYMLNLKRKKKNQCVVFVFVFFFNLEPNLQLKTLCTV